MLDIYLFCLMLAFGVFCQSYKGPIITLKISKDNEFGELELAEEAF